MAKNSIVGLIGIGNVGATLAFILANKNICSKILIKDIKKDLGEATKLDISQALAATGNNTKIIFVEKDEDFKNCDVIVISAGIPRKPGLSREDLLLTNAKIMHLVTKNLKQFNPNAKLIIISNPLDAMVYCATKSSNYEPSKVIGMAGVLDSARFKFFINEKLNSANSDYQQIKAYTIGAHGNTMIPLVNHSSIDDVPLNTYFNKNDLNEIIENTKQGGPQIVNLLKNGSAFYAPAQSASLMVEAILKNSEEKFVCTVNLGIYKNIENPISGTLITLNKNGINKISNLNLDETEEKKFIDCIKVTKELTESLDNLFYSKNI